MDGHAPGALTHYVVADAYVASKAETVYDPTEGGTSGASGYDQHQYDGQYYQGGEYQEQYRSGYNQNQQYGVAHSTDQTDNALNTYGGDDVPTGAFEYVTYGGEEAEDTSKFDYDNALLQEQDPFESDQQRPVAAFEEWQSGKVADVIHHPADTRKQDIDGNAQPISLESPQDTSLRIPNGYEGVEEALSLGKLRQRRGLCFGFGGRLLFTDGIDLVVGAPGEILGEVKTQPESALDSFAPLLGNTSTSDEAMIKNASTSIASQGETSWGANEDGEIPHSTALLWRALAAFVSCKGKRSEGLSLAGPANETFEHDLLAILRELDVRDLSVMRDVLAVEVRRDTLKGDFIEFENRLLRGEKDSAVHYAMENDMWAQALIVAHHASASLYRRVVSEFTSKTVAKDSPMHVVFQVLAGRGIQGVREAGQIDRNWTRLLRAILSNRSPGDQVAIRELGDRLWSECKSVAAAHLCYLAAGNGCLEPSDRVMLVGGDHVTSSIALRYSFVTPGSIIRTEAFLFAQSLNSLTNSTPAFLTAMREFQPFRLVFAMWLSDRGNVTLAKEWVKAIRAGDLGNDAVFEEQLQMFEARLFGTPVEFKQSPRPLSVRLTAIENVEINRATGFNSDEKNDEAMFLEAHASQKRSITPPPMFDVSMLSPQPLDKSLLDDFGPSPFTRTKESNSKERDIDTAEETMPSGFADPFAAGKTRMAAPTPSRPRLDAAPTPAKPTETSEVPRALPPKPIAAAPSQPRPTLGDNGQALTESNQQPASSKPTSRPTETKSSGWFSMDFRGWLTQKMLGVPKNATVAKTGSKLTAVFDEKLNRWVFPDEDRDAAAGSALEGPPVMKPVNASGDNGGQRGGGDGGPSGRPPSQIIKNRYVVAT